MDSEQARLILGAYRPGRDDAGDALFAEALAQMERDPALAEWFSDQNAADESMRSAMRSIQPPAHLREAILSSAKITPFPTARFSWSRPAWLAVAAAVVIGLGAGFFFSSGQGGKLPLAALDAEIPRLTDAHKHAVESGAGDLDKIRAWLAANGGAADFAVPGGLKSRGGVACEIASVRGQKVSILCFGLGGGRTAHLYVVDRSQLSDPPPVGTPEIRQQGAYATASWSDGGHSYILAQRGDADSLRGLL